MADQEGTTAMERAEAHLARRGQRGSTVKDMLERAMPQIRRAVPRHVSPERIARVALSTIGRDGKLLRCSPESLVRAVLEAAAYGLEPTGVLGHAALVPYKDEVQLVIMYRGLMELAYRSGKVLSIDAEVVREGETFEVEYGSRRYLRHVPGDDESARVVRAYAHATLRDGGEQFVVVGLAAIEAARKASRHGDAGPWATHWDEMAKKTAIRRLAKRLPLAPELTSAVAADEARDAGIDVRVVDDADPPDAGREE